MSRESRMLAGVLLVTESAWVSKTLQEEVVYSINLWSAALGGDG